MRKILILAALLPLAACAGTTQSPWSGYVSDVQTAWPIAEVGINLALAEAKASPAVVAAATKAETQISAEIAALPSTAAPASAAAVLADVKALVNGLPPGTLSATHEAEAQGLIMALTLLVNYTGG
jgi:hypothetical protein